MRGKGAAPDLEKMRFLTTKKRGPSPRTSARRRRLRRRHPQSASGGSVRVSQRLRSHGKVRHEGLPERRRAQALREHGAQLRRVVFHPRARRAMRAGVPASKCSLSTQQLDDDAITLMKEHSLEINCCSLSAPIRSVPRYRARKSACASTPDWAPAARRRRTSAARRLPLGFGTSSSTKWSPWRRNISWK